MSDLRDRFRGILGEDSIGELEEVVWPAHVLSSMTVGAPIEYPREFKAGQPALHAACSNLASFENLQVVRWLLSHSPDIVPRVHPPTNFSALHAAALHGNLPAAKAILAKNSSDQLLNACMVDGGERIGGGTLERFSALQLASAAGHADMVELLLEQKGINVGKKDDCGLTAVMAAIIYAPISADDKSWDDRQKIVSMLHFAGAGLLDVDMDGENVFHQLARRPSESRDYSIWFHLYSLVGADAVHAKNHDDETPLHVACRSQQISAISFLLSRARVHGDLFLPNKYGQFPHHLLFEQAPRGEESLSCIKFVLETEGCDVGCTLIDANKLRVNGGRDTMLTAAIRHKLPYEVVDLLINGGADILQPKSTNPTPRLPEQKCPDEGAKTDETGPIQDFLINGGAGILQPKCTNPATSANNSQEQKRADEGAKRDETGPIQDALELAAVVHPALLVELVRRQTETILELRRQIRAASRNYGCDIQPPGPRILIQPNQ